MSRFLGVLLLVLGTSLSVSLLGFSSANASSPWDNLFETADRLEIVSPNGEHRIDVSLNYMHYFNGDYDHPTSDDCTEFADIFNFTAGNSPTGKYIIYNYNSGSNSSKEAMFRAVNSNEDNPSIRPIHEDNTGTQVDDYYYFQLHYSKIQGSIWIDNNGTIYTSCNFHVDNSEDPWWVGAISSPITRINGFVGSQDSFEIFVNTYPIDLPPDFIGDLPPDSWTPPTPPRDYIPDFYISGAIDWTVSIHDLNFNTFDKIHWTCVDGTAPVIDYSIYKDNGNDPAELLESKLHSATVQIDFKAPKVQEIQKYFIRGIYICDDGINEFELYGERSFEINKYGLVESTMFRDCMLDEPPWIHIEDCIENVYVLFNRLSFNILFDTYVWTHNADCHTLTVLHTWIGVEGNNRILCPKFSSTVRNTVTPFVTFIFGLVTVSFIAGRARHGSMKDDL